jgi:glycosyltransferase involved in cell wall biosynthesis
VRHVLHVLTVPDSLVFLEGQVAFMRERGWTMTVVTSPGTALDAFGQRHGVDVHAISMPRKVSPAKDAKSLAQLSAFIRKTKPDLVHAHTPKGGLLGTIAATIARVKARIYHMRGLPLLTAVSTQRKILTATERTSCSLARIVIANSHSLRDYAIEHRLCSENKIRVLGSGSGNGVDAEGRFNPAHVPTDARTSFRRDLGIPENAPVIGFLGRLVRDKGVVELADAWARIRVAFPDAHLVLGGIFEERDPVPPATRVLLESDVRVHVMGFVTDTPRFFAAIDVFTLPTYREGFPNVLLEAAAMQCAIVSTKAMGAIDAVVDGTTGTLVPPRDDANLAAALRSYLDDPAKRGLHGKAARARALTEFRRERLWTALADVYDELVSS